MGRPEGDDRPRFGRVEARRQRRVFEQLGPTIGQRGAWERIGDSADIAFDNRGDPVTEEAEDEEEFVGVEFGQMRSRNAQRPRHPPRPRIRLQINHLVEARRPQSRQHITPRPLRHMHHIHQRPEARHDRRKRRPHEEMHLARTLNRRPQCRDRRSRQHDVPDGTEADEENAGHAAKLRRRPYLRARMRLIDTHTHLYQPKFDDDRPAAMERCRAAGVETLLLPNIDTESIPRVKAMMADFPGRALGMMGLHPCHVQAETMEAELEAIGEELHANASSYVAVGEIGVDLYWDKSTLPQQQEAFRRQVAWAKALDLPIVIHVRDAFPELFELLDEVNDNALSGVVHCFTGTPADAERVLAYGDFYLGIGGVATYKNGGLDLTLPTIARDRVILETDSPYLAPVPFRGKRNESAYVVHVAERVADFWYTSVEEVAAITTANAERLFRLTAPEPLS